MQLTKSANHVAAAPGKKKKDLLICSSSVVELSALACNSAAHKMLFGFHAILCKLRWDCCVWKAQIGSFWDIHVHQFIWHQQPCLRLKSQKWHSSSSWCWMRKWAEVLDQCLQDFMHCAAAIFGELDEWAGGTNVCIKKDSLSVCVCVCVCHRLLDSPQM